jgi:methionyl-tRNA formyltransferase
MSIIFFGTSSFSAFVLEQLLKSGYQIVAIVTRPDRVQGRRLQVSSPPVKDVALKICPHIPLFQPEKASSPEFAEILSTFKASLFVVVAYGEIIKKNLLEMPSLGCINIHASLLPAYRGAAPMQRCLMAGDKETGITIIEMSPQMDAGDILAIEAIPIPTEMTLVELEEQLRILAVKLVSDVINQYGQGTVVKRSQDHSMATLAPKLMPEDERIDWTRSAEQIHNQIRALSPAPCAWCQLQIGPDLKRLKIKKARVYKTAESSPGALIHFGKEGWVIGCGTDALELQEVQLEGKKMLSAGECLRGIHGSVSVL